MGFVALVFSMASLGLPGLGNFVAEFLTLIGSWQVSHILTILATIGLVGATAYSLRIMQRVFFGQETKNDHHEIHDLSLREKLMMVPLVLVIVWLGFFPQPVLDTSKVPINNVLRSTTVNSSIDKVALDEDRKGGNHE